MLCICVLGGFKRCYVFIGDIIVVMVKDVILGGIKKGMVLKVVVVCIKKEICWKDGIYICFDDNVVVLLIVVDELRGICIFGFVVCELREKDFMWIVLFVFEVL